MYKLVTSIEARIAFFGSFVLCMRRSTKHEILSVGPSHPDIIGLPTSVGL